jgi:stage II sporulation protein AB (anti-sigma F factor)
MKSKKIINEMKITLPSLSVNEGVARSMVAAFCAQANPTAVDIADVKCAVSEAITNCIVHGYKEGVGSITISVKLYEDNLIKINVKDKGCGIENITEAMQPLFTTDSDNERSGIQLQGYGGR